MSKTIFIECIESQVLEEPFTYKETFKKYQEIWIESVVYSVLSHEVNTSGNHKVFIKKIYSEPTHGSVNEE